MLAKITEISTDTLRGEIDAVEPKYNRDEMTLAMSIAADLYKTGKRQDSLKVLEKMKRLFGETEQWEEFKDEFDKLYNYNQKIKKR